MTANARGSSRRAQLLLALCSTLLTGCAQLADYRRPEVAVASVWPASIKPEGKQIAAKIGWRTFFPDSRLQALISIALEHSHDVRMASARVEEARATYGITRADRFPTVAAVGSRNSLSYSTNLISTNPTLQQKQSITYQRYDANLSALSFEIDFWGRLAGLSESARAAYLATEEAHRAVRLSVVADIANAYFSLLDAKERLVIAQSAVVAREQALALVVKGRARGFASEIDYLQAEDALESARTAVSTLERDQAAALNWLNSLTMQVEIETLPAGRALTMQEIEVELDAGIPAEVLLSRPDVVAAEQRLMAAHANVGAARTAFLPKILLTTTMGYASLGLKSLFAVGSNAWTFQPSLTLPIFDAGRMASNVDLAEARKEIAVAEYEKAIEQAFREVADLLATRASLLGQRRSAEAHARIQERRLKVAQALFKAGNASYFDVLNAQQEHFSALQAAIQVRRTQLTTAAQLFKALGGGEFEEDAASSATN